MSNQYGFNKSFSDWCKENNRKDLLDRWDYNLNKCSPQNIGYYSNKKYYFKCPRGIHKSELKELSNFLCGEKGSMNCKACNSFAQWGLDTIGQDFLIKYWDWDKNKEERVNPWNIDKSCGKYVYIYCQEKSYHGSYKIRCADFYNGKRCTYCGNKQVHRFDSLGWVFPQVIKIWSNKNIQGIDCYMNMSVR